MKVCFAIGSVHSLPAGMTNAQRLPTLALSQSLSDSLCRLSEVHACL